MAGFPLKIQYRDVIKRAQFKYGDASNDKDQNMADMYGIIKGLFGINQPNSNIHLTFIDDENDSISFSSDRELDAAFALVKSEGWKAFKINVTVDNVVDSSSSSDEGVVVVKLEKAKEEEKKEMVMRKEKNIEKSVPSSPPVVVAAAKLSVPVVSKEKEEREEKTKAKATFIPNVNAPAFVPKDGIPNQRQRLNESIKAAKKKSLKSASTTPSVPLRATSGGAYIYPDGTVEFGMGGEAFLLPDGKTVSCTLSYRGFPSVAAAGTVLTEGKWYYEAMILTDGLMQIGWCDTKFEGNSNFGEGVGDDAHSIAYDGKRKLKWHNGRSQPFGDRWKAGDVVCCAANLDDGIVKFALNGKWNDRSTAFSSLVFHDGLMPAASFSKGEKLCFNFGSASSGYVHGPPNEEYLPVYIAQGNVNTLKKMKKVMEKQQQRKEQWKEFNKSIAKKKMMMKKEDVGKTSAMPPPPPYATCNTNNSTTGEEGGPTVKERFIALLLKDDVRAAITHFLANPQVALMIQHMIVAVLSGSTDAIQAQIASMIPLLIQLGSEAPALLGLIPIFTDPNFIQQFRGDNNTSASDDGDNNSSSSNNNKSSSSNAYSDTNFPPPPPGVWGGWHHHHPRHHHHHRHHGGGGNRCPWKKGGGCVGNNNNNNNNSQHHHRHHGDGGNRCPWKKGGGCVGSNNNNNNNNSQRCWRNKNRYPWKKGGCKGKWAGGNQQTRNVGPINKPTTTDNTTESPVATFGKMMSNVLNATGGQAMKWVGEMCEQPMNEKQFSSDLQKAITQSLKETQPVYQQKPPGVCPFKTVNKNTVSSSNNKNVAVDNNNNNNNTVTMDPNVAARPRAKFVEQFAVTNTLKDGNVEEQRVSLLTMLPGEKVSHVWKMVNPSEANSWPKGVCAKSVGGDDFVIQTKEWMPLSMVAPKATVNITVDAIAPEKPGRYIHYWRLHDSNNTPFGDRIWLDMTVVLKKPDVVVEEEVKKVVATAPSLVKIAMSSPPAPSSTQDRKIYVSQDELLNAALINKLLDNDLKILPESENNNAIGVEEEITDDVKDDDVKQSDAKEDDVKQSSSNDVKQPAITNPPVVIVEKEELEAGNLKSSTTALEDVEQMKPPAVLTKDVSDTLSTTSTSTSTSSVSNPDEQWDLLHSSSFTDDFTVSSESMMRVQKYTKQLDLLSSMGFSNRDALIKLLDQHNGDVQKVINSFVSSK